MEKDSKKNLPSNTLWPKADQATIAMMVMMAQPDRTLGLYHPFKDASLVNQAALPTYQSLLRDPSLNLLPINLRNPIEDDPLLNASIKLHYLQQLNRQNLIRDPLVPKFVHEPNRITPPITSQPYKKKLDTVQNKNATNTNQETSADQTNLTQSNKSKIITLNPKELEFNENDDTLSSIGSESDLSQFDKMEPLKSKDQKSDSKAKSRRRAKKSRARSTNRTKGRKKVKKY